MPRITLQEAGTPQVLAFLDMLAVSELGIALILQTDDGYNVLVGATATHPLTFGDYSQHPNILNQKFDSTAAGRYQELHRNWVAYQQRLSLSDFGPVNQDRIAIQQIRECGALFNVSSGRTEQAIELCAPIWASLPGAGYGQHENALSDLMDTYRGYYAKYSAAEVV